MRRRIISRILFLIVNDSAPSSIIDDSHAVIHCMPKNTAYSTPALSAYVPFLLFPL